MAALAPGTPWIPGDDLLLKNAVEAGASLESLAKGAVQFSRRFTLRELQDRWHSLLYDPIISAEAALMMIEFERSASNPTSKSNRVDNSKENKCSQGKRKAESVRRRYYAMRKKLCNEPLNHEDLSFLVAPGDNCFVRGAEALGPNNMLGDPEANHFGLEVANFNDLHDVFPQVIGDSAPCGVGGFQLGQQSTIEVPIDQNTVSKDVPGMLGNNMGMDENCTSISQMDMSKALPDHNIFDANGLKENPGCNSKDIMCTDFRVNTIFNSPLSDCENSLHHLQYTSTPPAMPDWRPIEDISPPEMPGDVSMRGSNVETGDPFSIASDGDAAKGTSQCMEPDSMDQMSCSGLRNSTEGYFAELSASLLNFSDEEMLGRKDVIDRTYFEGLTSLLLNSPSDVNEDKTCNLTETQETFDSGAYLDNPGGKGSDDKNKSADPSLGDVNLQPDAETQIPPPIESEIIELCNGVICCTLNMEDPEIPCNDDIAFPSKPRPTSAHRRTPTEANNLSVPGKDNISNHNNDKGHGAMKREVKRYGESHPASENVGSDVGPKHTVDGSGVKCGTSRGESLNGSGAPSSSYVGSCLTSLAAKNGSSELAKQSGRSNAETPVEVVHLQTGLSGINLVGRTPTANRNQDYHAPGLADPMVTERGGESLSDPEEQYSESDTDIPYFSDIESMILDMDLDPDDQDCFSLREGTYSRMGTGEVIVSYSRRGTVAKYQHEDAKRAILRFEQNAHSYMQRAIASHGACAVLYGRHSKHYIKKTEVLLGRATDDIAVDIDLGREGRANKISRRQAIIKLDKDGTFNLKNLGKYSIYVNSKELFPGQRLGLHSNCLIEIRGMPFIFEMNQARIKQYLDNGTMKFEDKRLTA